MKRISPAHSTPYYQKIKEILEQVKSQDILPRLTGNCIAASDLIQNLLGQHGISSRIVEVQLTATRFYENNTSEFLFVGFDNIKFPGQVDSHLVVITDTDIPLMIDSSIQHILNGTGYDYILHDINTTEHHLADYRIDNLQLTYQIKKSVKWPVVHQRNLVERMAEEKRVRETLNLLKLWTIVGLGMSIFNMCANSLLVLLKIINP